MNAPKLTFEVWFCDRASPRTRPIFDGARRSTMGYGSVPRRLDLSCTSPSASSTSFKISAAADWLKNAVVRLWLVHPCTSPLRATRGNPSLRCFAAWAINSAPSLGFLIRQSLSTRLFSAFFVMLKLRSDPVIVGIAIVATVAVFSIEPIYLSRWIAPSVHGGH